MATRLLLVLVFLCATDFCRIANASNASDWHLQIQISPAAKSVGVHVFVYQIAVPYRLRIYGIGPYTLPPPFPAASDLREIARETSNGIVMNGGPNSGDPFSPAGLMLLAGRSTHPMSLRKKSGSNDYPLSVIVCQDKSGKLRLLKTADYDNTGADIKSDCFSGFQAGPLVVQNGQNGVRPRELALAPHRRTIIGIDAAGTLCAVFFTDPINLFAAAEFLRAPTTNTAKSLLIFDQAGRLVHAAAGLALVTAANLDGDDNSVAFVRGQRAIGNPLQAIPSAIAITPASAAN